MEHLVIHLIFGMAAIVFVIQIIKNIATAIHAVLFPNMSEGTPSHKLWNAIGWPLAASTTVLTLLSLKYNPVDLSVGFLKLLPLEWLLGNRLGGWIFLGIAIALTCGAMMLLICVWVAGFTLLREGRYNNIGPISDGTFRVFGWGLMFLTPLVANLIWSPDYIHLGNWFSNVYHEVDRNGSIRTTPFYYIGWLLLVLPLYPFADKGEKWLSHLAKKSFVEKARAQAAAATAKRAAAAPDIPPPKTKAEEEYLALRKQWAVEYVGIWKSHLAPVNARLLAEAKKLKVEDYHKDFTADELGVVG